MAVKGTIAEALQDKIDSKEAIKQAIIAKGVTVDDELLSDYAGKVAAIAQDPSIPVGVGQHLVTFYDFDGKVLKRQRVSTGDNAIAPTTPTHQYLTFAEWNNPFTNVQSDIDTGAIYNTTDGKTYLFITLTAVTGLAPTLFFWKSSASLMTIDWGDGTTSTSTTAGNKTIQHTYAIAGDYIITVDNSAGGIYRFSSGDGVYALFNYKQITTKLYFGAHAIVSQGRYFQDNYSLKYISFYKITQTVPARLFQDCRQLIHVNFPSSFSGSPTLCFYNCYSLRKFIYSGFINIIEDFVDNRSISKLSFGTNLLTIAGASFQNCYAITQYIFYSTTPPTLANINAFTGINQICKIYVPDASVEAYKAATNWITYANYIYPLSQKPQSDE